MALLCEDQAKHVPGRHGKEYVHLCSLLFPHREGAKAKPDGLADGLEAVQSVGHDHEGDRQQGDVRHLLIRAITNALRTENKEVTT